MADLDPRVAEFIERHRSVCAPLQRIAVQLSVGTCEVTIDGEPGARSRELLSTYTVRAAHLARLRSPHAQALHAEVLQFCAALERYRHDSARLWAFQGIDGSTVALFEAEDGTELLGCMQSFARTKVTDERWREIWGPDACDLP